MAYLAVYAVIGLAFAEIGWRRNGRYGGLVSALTYLLFILLWPLVILFLLGLIKGKDRA